MKARPRKQERGVVREGKGEEIRKIRV